VASFSAINAQEETTVKRLSRRELLQQAGIVTATSVLASSIPSHGLAIADPQGGASESAYAWIRSARMVIAEGYNPPFYPSFDYEPEKALAIARQLNADAIRYPTASYYAYFPTKTKYPIHPELGSRDPLRRTVELFHDAGLKVVAYNPLNHPFMDVHAKNPDYEDWVRRDLDGRPITTPHMGWTEFIEGCLNSPLRDVIQARVREVLSSYPVDVMYFDGPYQGFNSQRFCHCRYCKVAYKSATGKTIPLQNGTTRLEDEIEYRRWMSEDVVIGFLRKIREMIRQTRDVPVLYNNTDLLNKGEWRSRGFRSVDGFMFEAADTPEQKLFNMQLGQSTGKVIWTYLGSYAEFNGEHMKDRSVQGWYSYPVEGQQLLLDGAVATAANVGFCYWGLQRFFYMPEGEVCESGQYVKEVFDFAGRHEALLRSAKPVPQAGVLVGSQTIDWYQGQKFVLQAYQNYYQGAYQLLKGLSYDAEPFLDYEMTAERLAKYKLLFVPNAPCLSDAQCATITKYVEDGGALVATHLTSVADEYGRTRSNYGLAELLGATWKSPEPVEIPDLYLRILSSGKLIPQDPQAMSFEAAHGTEVIGETYDRGHRRTLGPAVVTRRHGKGRVTYIGSGLEAIYEETLMEPLRAYFASLLDPILGEFRTYEVEFRLGLMPQFAASRDTLLLHLLADTGNVWKELPAREQFLPVTNIRVRVRVPQGRDVKSVSLLRTEQSPKWAVRDGWVELTVPRVLIHEVVRVELA
jgi:hypothetical protein